MADVSQIFSRNAEAELQRITDEISVFPVRYTAVYYAFSYLQKEYRDELQLKLAINIVHEILQYHLHYIFLLKNGDMYVIFKSGRIASDSRAYIEKISFQLRYLFIDDPLTYKTVQDAGVSFYRSFILETDWDSFKTHVNEKINSLGVPSAPAAPSLTTNHATPMSNITKELTPAVIAELEQKLKVADIKSLLRNQYICALSHDNVPSTIFNEIFVSISSVTQLLDYQVNLTAKHHLFLYLTEILDKLLLEHIREYPEFHGKAASINLNIETIFSNEFKAFNESLSAGVRKTILIEIQNADVFTHIERAMEAKAFLQQQGYRVCLDGLNKMTFLQLQEDALGFDLLKLMWNADLPSQLSSDDNKKLVHQVAKFSPTRVILCRCDSSLAIDYGRKLGLALFQGWHLDKLMNKDSAM